MRVYHYYKDTNEVYDFDQVRKLNCAMTLLTIVPPFSTCWTWIRLTLRASWSGGWSTAQQVPTIWPRWRLRHGWIWSTGFNQMTLCSNNSSDIITPSGLVLHLARVVARAKDYVRWPALTHKSNLLFVKYVKNIVSRYPRDLYAQSNLVLKTNFI